MVPRGGGQWSWFKAALSVNAGAWIRPTWDRVQVGVRGRVRVGVQLQVRPARMGRLPHL